MAKVDEWTTREDLSALARVAAIKKDPARMKACTEAIAHQQSALGKDIKPGTPTAAHGGKKDTSNKMGDSPLAAKYVVT